jgi:putative ABC transport system permease protein
MIPIVYNIRSLTVRKTTTIAAGLGVALVAFVFSTAAMLSEGIKRTLSKSGSADVAVVIRKGSDVELSSSVEDPQVGLVLAGPGVKKDESGAPIGVSEVVAVIALDKLGTDGGVSNVQVRGVNDNVLKLRTGVRVVTGRQPRPGTDEGMVGRAIRGRFRGLDIGQSFELRKGRSVQVVGVFEDDGSSFESEVWCDRDTLRAAFGREGVVSSVRVRLQSPALYDAFEAFVERDKQLGLEAFREPEYYNKQSEGMAKFVIALGTMIATFFSIGAMIGAMITMHASVADREREIGTLRALGFSRVGILFSFLLESLMLAVAGGTVGALASMLMGFARFSMINFQSWSEMVFTFEPHPDIIMGALIRAGIMGLVGGLLPAIRAARVSPVRAMRG